MVDLFYLGFDTETPSWSDRVRLLDAPRLPFDGMNEYGLAVGMMAVPHAEDSVDPQQSTIDSLLAMRLILDGARTVDEAVSLLQGYNVGFGDGPPLHYLVSDPTGHSAVIEFIAGEMTILRNEQPWQVATNFLLSGQTPESARRSCWRYAAASDVLGQAQGALVPEEAMDLLEDVSQSLTVWSVVYSMSSGDISVAMGRDYDQVHQFTLEMVDH
jgi:choloylglycine hydrolase